MRVNCNFTANQLCTMRVSLRVAFVQPRDCACLLSQVSAETRETLSISAAVATIYNQILPLMYRSFLKMFESLHKILLFVLCIHCWAVVLTQFRLPEL